MTWIAIGLSALAAIAASVGALISYLNLKLIDGLYDRIDEHGPQPDDHLENKSAEVLLLERLNSMVGGSFVGKSGQKP